MEFSADINDIDVGEIDITCTGQGATNVDEEFSTDWFNASKQSGNSKSDSLKLQANTSCCVVDISHHNSILSALDPETGPDVKCTSDTDAYSHEHNSNSGTKYTFIEIENDIDTSEQVFSQNEWDNVQNFSLSAVEGDVPHSSIVEHETSQPIKFDNILNFIKQHDFSELSGQIKPTISKKGFQAFLNFFTGPPKLKRELVDDRNLLFLTALLPFDQSNTIHSRIIQSIYKKLTGNKFDCPHFGTHWEIIGFQGTNPATDFRGAGLLGLISIFHFVFNEDNEDTWKKTYAISQDTLQNFPFCLIGINLTTILLQIVRENYLNKMFNKRREILQTFFTMYNSLFLRFFMIWSKGHKTIVDAGIVLQELQASCSKNPSDLLDFYLTKSGVPNLQASKLIVDQKKSSLITFTKLD